MCCAFTRTKREVFDFFGAGALLAVRDLNGYTTSLAYDGAGKLATVTDAAGRSLRFSHGADGRIAGVADPAERVVSYTRDPVPALAARPPA